jgi:hypothetical protein
VGGQHDGADIEETGVRAQAPIAEFERIANRAKRELMARVPPVGRAAEMRYARRLRHHAGQLAPLSATHAELVSRLRSEGAIVTTLDELGLSGTDALKESLSNLAARLADHRGSDRLGRDDVVETGAWQWGIRTDVLALVENYLGLPALYCEPEVRRERANGRDDTVRQWHRDPEDHRMFKIIVWLRDVSPAGGAFEWVPRQHTEAATRQLGYVSGFVSDSEMERVMPRSLWRSAPGPRWTAVLGDTQSIFHRAGVPQDKDRYSITFSWTSRWPIKPFPVDPFSAAQAEAIRQGLCARQRAALPRAIR